MTELSFLLDLLLNHKLPKGSKEAVVHRIKEIEERTLQPQTLMSALQPIRQPKMTQVEPEVVTLTNPDGSSSQIDLSKQSPSMRAKLLAQQQAPVTLAPSDATIETQIQPAVIAQTPAAAAALAARNQAIAIAVSGVEEKGRTSPRKF